MLPISRGEYSAIGHIIKQWVEIYNHVFTKIYVPSTRVYKYIC